MSSKFLYKKCRMCKHRQSQLLYVGDSVIGWYCLFCNRGLMNGQRVGTGWK